MISKEELKDLFRIFFLKVEEKGYEIDILKDGVNAYNKEYYVDVENIIDLLYKEYIRDKKINDILDGSF